MPHNARLTHPPAREAAEAGKIDLRANHGPGKGMFDMYTLTTRNTETEYATGDEAWEAWARRVHGREPGDSLSRDGTVLVYVPRAGSGVKRRWVMGQIRGRAERKAA